MAAYQYAYVMKDLTKAYPGGREVFKGITLSFLPGVKIGVLGVNGAGKSTLLKIMAGRELEYGGEAWAAEGVRVGYLEQEPHLDPDLTVAENVMLAFGPLKAAIDRFNAISEEFGEEMSDDKMNTLLAEQAELQEKIDAEDGWELDRRIEIALDALRCPPPDSAVTKLSGGERRRVALCRLLLDKPELLLLDEPTNHLDAESVAWLEKTLRDYAGTVMIVTHDRYFLDNVTNWILEIERGRGYPFEGNYSSWLDQKRKRLKQEEKEESSRQRALAAEQEWIQSSPRARQTKSRARIDKYEQMLAKSAEMAGATAEIVIPPGPRLGGTVITAENLRKGYGNHLLINDLNFKLPPRRHRRRDRAQRRRQDHHVPHDHRAGSARRRHAGGGRDGQARLRGPVARQPGRVKDRLGGDQRRHGRDLPRQACRAVPRLRRRIQLQGVGPAEARRRAVRRRAQPGPPGQDAEKRKQRYSPGRTDERPGRGHVAGAGGGAGRVRRVRRDHQP